MISSSLGNNQLSYIYTLLLLTKLLTFNIHFVTCGTLYTCRLHRYLQFLLPMYIDMLGTRYYYYYCILDYTYL